MKNPGPSVLMKYRNKEDIKGKKEDIREKMSTRDRLKPTTTWDWKELRDISPVEIFKQTGSR